MEPNPRPSLQFLGAAGTVTGSRYLIESAGQRILVDCGLFQGYKQLRERNRADFPVPPDSIDSVLLTHAHLDHSGYIPALVRNGFRGKVICTPATRELCSLLLPDSGYLQEEEAKYARKKGFSRHANPTPLYTVEDAEAALERFVVHDFDQESQADVLVCESTYGNRQHVRVDAEAELAPVIRRVAARGGVIVIPAFAVGRAQGLMLHIARLRQRGEIPAVPVFLNSPMAINATAITPNITSPMQNARPCTNWRRWSAAWTNRRR